MHQPQRAQVSKIYSEGFHRPFPSKISIHSINSIKLFDFIAQAKSNEDGR